MVDTDTLWSKTTEILRVLATGTVNVFLTFLLIRHLLLFRQVNDGNLMVI